MSRTVIGLIAISVLTACSTIREHTVKEHKVDNGNTVFVGQQEPEAKHECVTLETEQQDWGVGGRVNPTDKYNSIVQEVLKKASEHEANYVYIDLPGDASILGVNVRVFSDADVIYYRCQNPPGN
jgi:spore coat polysaccharide biosynthesis protein SpsF (cytidylyltransferase family)